MWFSSITRTAIGKNKRVLILCHREELIDQISATLDRFNVPHGIIAANYEPNLFCHVQIGSVFTVVRRLGRIVKPDLIISDEAHHCVKESTWGKILFYYSDALKIGVTATPCRTSGEPLGDIFDSLILGPSVRELIKANILSDYRLFAPTSVSLEQVHVRGGDYVKSELSELMDRPTITGDAVGTYIKYASGKRAVAFCVSIQHAHHTAAAFSEAGFSAMALDGDMDKHERRRRVSLFRAGKLQVLTSCDILNEGFDVKGIEVGIFLRPTQSLTLWLQQLGRCLRAMEGKDHVFLFDHANNALRLGLPDDDRDWSLQGSGKPSSKHKAPVRMCTKCYAVCSLGSRTCKWCGEVFEVKPREVKIQQGELEEIMRDGFSDMNCGGKLGRDVRAEVRAANTLAELRAIAARRGYSPRWAFVQLKLKKRGFRGPINQRGGTNHERLSVLADAYRPKRKTDE